MRLSRNLKRRPPSPSRSAASPSRPRPPQRRAPCSSSATAASVTTTRRSSRGGPQRVHRDEHGALTAGGLAPYDVVVLAQTEHEHRPGRGPERMGPGRRQPRRDAARPELAGLLGLGSNAGELSDGYIDIDTAHRSRRRDHQRQHAVPWHRRPLDARRRPVRRHARRPGDEQSAQSGGDAAQRRPAGGQTAAFTYDLARSVVDTRQGNPASAGQKRDGQSGPIRSDDLFFAGLARLQQGPHPPGRRAAAAAGEPRSPR